MKRENHRKAAHAASRINKTRRALAIVLAVILIIGAAAPVTALAMDANTPKQEVVYINLNADGSVEKIYVVNIFDLDEDGRIIDYGDYTALRNMTSNDEIQFEDETVRIDTKEDKVYYEGILSDRSIPWDFSIHYYMDGKEYPAQELAGKSGAFELTISVRQNTDCDSTFFDNYSLQAAVTLDSEKCRNIVAEDATPANVGGDRQLSYVILPGAKTDISVTADVTDFEMSGIAINALPLSMDVNVDGNEEINGQVDELNDAVTALDDGANDLKDGASDLKDGSADLEEGVSGLKDGVSALADGVRKLKTGALSLDNGLEDLDKGLSRLSGKSDTLTDGAYSVFEQLCTQAETQLNAQLTANGMKKVTLTPENYEKVLFNLLKQMDADKVYNQAGQEDVSAVIESAARISDLKNQLDSYQTFYSGLQEYTKGVDSAAAGAKKLKEGCGDLVDGIATLQDGTTELENGTIELLDGAIALHDGTVKLSDGTVELSDGTFEFRDETSDMKTNLSDKIKEAVDDMLGGNFTVKSFVSEKNTEVESVQFVIKTPSIELDDTESVEEDKDQEQSFWDRLLNLFRR